MDLNVILHVVLPSHDLATHCAPPLGPHLGHVGVRVNSCKHSGWRIESQLTVTDDEKGSTADPFLTTKSQRRRWFEFFNPAKDSQGTLRRGLATRNGNRFGLHIGLLLEY